MMKHLGNCLSGVQRCPHCGIAQPLLNFKWSSDFTHLPDTIQGGRRWWVYQCTSCTYYLLAGGKICAAESSPDVLDIVELHPQNQSIPNEIPQRARTYLEQAKNSLFAPDGAAMLAGSAVDAMLKAKGLDSDKSLYDRINDAVTRNILTPDMAEWAHSVRLGSNRPRHADNDDPHVSIEEAKQTIEFAYTLGELLFVLPARIAIGKVAATATEIA